MAAPSPSTVVIACPNCGTRYQLAREALGKKRMVKCANCETAWQALPIEPEPLKLVPDTLPPDDQLFDPAEERALDRQFEAEERAETASAEAEAAPPRLIADIVASIAPKPRHKGETPPVDHTAVARKLQHAFALRRVSLNKSLPMARLRTTARQVGLACLVVLVAVMVLMRGTIVQQFPDLAGAYDAIGLGVNVVGLEFQDVRTLKSLRDGVEVLTVNVRVASVADHPVIVPQVVVTLLDAAGGSIYEWSVTPQARDLEPGEAVDVETQLTRPPTGASGVRLTFARGHAQAEVPLTTLTLTEQPA